MRTAQQEQERTLETLELFGEMYMTLSLFPLLLIIILVIMSMLGEAQTNLLYGTVYALIPLTGGGFLVLISTVKQDEPGDGYLDPETEDVGDVSADTGLLGLGLVNRYVGTFSVFERVKRREGSFELKRILRRPHLFFRDHPMLTMAVTVPLSLVIVGAMVATGRVPTALHGTCVGGPEAILPEVSCSSPNVATDESGAKEVITAGLIQKPVWSTFVYVYIPIYLVGVPLAAFREWNVRSRRRIISKLSDNLRKLSSANDTGLTLLESIRTVSETTSGKLGEEFEIMYAKVEYGMSLKDALVEFNNEYHIPRLARTVKLISKAQEASSQITAVLTTAAQASENQDDIERERKSRTRMQVAIILMTYLTLLGVMAILKTQFLDVMSGLSSQAGDGGGGGGGGGLSMGGGINTGLLSLLFFHAVTIQAVLSGLISGYIRDADIMSGVKFIVVLATVALLTWMVVG
jgi:flagellar protein FlaJ